MLAPRILYVEDDEDIRSAVAQALSGEGFEVTAVSCAEDALRDLGANTFQVMLTDYRLPGENADWLLREGVSRGLLHRTPVIVLSADQHPKGIEGHVFLRKPIDLDALSAALAKAMSAQVTSADRISEHQVNRPKLLLTLYVTRTSHVSQKAIRNLHRALAKFDPASIGLVITDVAHLGDDAAGLQSIEEDRIVVTPTLVVRKPSPKVWIAGDLSDAKMVEEVIARGLASLAADWV